jgi:hypothetical protein
MLEGCKRNIHSLSDCLQQLPAARIIAAAATILKEPSMSQAPTPSATRIAPNVR